MHLKDRVLFSPPFYRVRPGSWQPRPFFPQSPALLFDLENGPGPVWVYQVLPTPDSFNNPLLRYLTFTHLQRCVLVPLQDHAAVGAAASLIHHLLRGTKGGLTPRSVPPTVGLVVCCRMYSHIQTSHTDRPCGCAVSQGDIRMLTLVPKAQPQLQSSVLDLALMWPG